MYREYQGVITRFLEDNERLIVSQEKEMPLVIEADDVRDLDFLRQFLNTNSKYIIEDMAKYGAVLLRGFALETDDDFEKTILSIPEFRGISEAFMSENGRVHVDNLNYVLHTNSVYKTGGTLYLGGFHTENYYSADVPGFLFFYCAHPSTLGGETGLINTQKIYSHLSQELKNKLEKNTFYVCKWSLKEVSDRYQISIEEVKTICEYFNLPIIGEGTNQFVLMYKPSILQHPLTQEKALQINMFEIETLNNELRKCFMKDYKGRSWFWHRFFWKLPPTIFNSIELLAMIFIAFFNSPKSSFTILRTKIFHLIKSKKTHLSSGTKVGSCFNDHEVKELAQLMRQYYSSCLWKKGDILLIDNKKVMHAGMPGKGPRLIRAMISNPLEINYFANEPGIFTAKDRRTETIGACMAQGKVTHINASDAFSC